MTAELSRKTTEKEALERGAHCDRCGHCCQFSSGLMIDGEDSRIAEHLGISPERLREHYLEESVQFNRRMLRPRLIRKGTMPYGRCIFYDGGCTINDVKPLHCRIGNCGPDGERLTDWFYINHVIDTDDEQSLKEWHLRTQTGLSLKGAHITELDVPEDVIERIKGGSS